MKVRNLLFSALMLLSSMIIAQTGTTIPGTIDVNGVTREYTYYVPDAILNGTVTDAVPLVMNIHGLTGTSDIQEGALDFRQIADTAHFIIIHPQGLERSPLPAFLPGIFGWATPPATYASIDEAAEDRQFLLDLIEKIKTERTIDTDRIYSAGFSQGGFMSHHFANINNDIFAAIGSVAGGLGQEFIDNANFTHATPAIIFHGEADSVVLYAGDPDLQDSEYMSVDDLVAYWVGVNNCDPTPIETAIPDNPSETDNSTATRFLYQNGDQGSTVEFFRINGTGAGHKIPSIPASTQYPANNPQVPSPPQGEQNRDVTAAVEMWRFFSQYDIKSLTPPVCIADDQCASAADGICPDTLKGSTVAFTLNQGTAFNDALSYLTPSSTPNPLGVLAIDSTIISDVQGLPPGLTWITPSGEATAHTYIPESWGCLQLSGTPTTAGTYTVSVTRDVYGELTTVTGSAVQVNPETGGSQDYKYVIEVIASSLPTLTTTSPISGITDINADGGGDITDDGGATVTERGLVWSESPSPTTADFMTSEGSGDGVFTSEMTGLTANTTYFVRAYATNLIGTSYGDEVQFTTLPTIPYDCTIDDQCASAGDDYCPDTMTVLSGEVDLAFDESLSFNTPSSLEAQGQTVSIDSIVMKRIEGLPSELTWVSPSGTEAPHAFTPDPDASWGCISIKGTPATAGTYTITVVRAVWGSAFNGFVPVRNQEIDYKYVIDILPAPELCTADETCNTGASCPDTMSVINGAPNELFEETITAVIGLTAEDPTFGTVPIDSAKITAVNNLPDGLTWTTVCGVETGCTYAPGTKNCLLISGTPTQIGVDTIEVIVEGFSFGQSRSGPLNYIIRIAPIPPTVTTTVPTSITDVSANSGGEITSGGGSVTERGIVWSEMSNPTLDLATKTSDGTGGGVFTSAITGLTASTTYFVRAYAINPVDTVYGNEETFTTLAPPTAPIVTTTAITSIADITAEGGGDITDNGGSAIIEKGIVWSETSAPTVDLTTKTTEGTGVGVFTSSLTNLTASTTYFVRAYATNSVGTSYGNEETFTTTTPVIPTLTTAAITNIADITAEGGGDITDNGGSAIIEKGIVWSEATAPTVDLTTKTTEGTGVGVFTSTLTNLAPNTEYFVRAYATNVAGTAYGEEVTFITTDVIIPICNTDDQCESASTGFCPAESSQFDVLVDSAFSESLSFFTPTTLPPPNPALAVDSFVVSDVSGLPEGITWTTPSGVETSHAYEPDTWGCILLSGNPTTVGTYTITVTRLVYGVQIPANSSTTSNYIINVTVPGEAPTLTTAATSDLSSSSVTSGGTIIDNGGVAITAKGLVWSTTSDPTIDDADKTDEGAGDDNFSSTIFGLTPNTTYFIRAYATNDVGTSYGEEITIMTTSTVGDSAKIRTTAAGIINTSTASTGGIVDSTGGTEVTQHGVVWDTVAGPTVTMNLGYSAEGLLDTAGIEPDTFMTTMSNLNGSTMYYYRAYVINGYGVSYGEEFTYTTPDTLSCSSDSTLASGEGVFPAELDNIDVTNLEFEQSFTYIVPFSYERDNNDGPQTVTLDSVELINIEGLPAGFDFTCGRASCIYYPGEVSCFTISGTLPNEEAEYNFNYEIKEYGIIDPFYDETGQNVGSQPVQNTQQSWITDSTKFAVVDSSKIFPVPPPLGIEDAEVASLNFLTCSPNPFNSFVNVKFSAETNEMIQFYITDVAGRELVRETINANAGENSMNYQLDNLDAGAYFFTLDNGKERVTKRMIAIK